MARLLWDRMGSGALVLGLIFLLPACEDAEGTGMRPDTGGFATGDAQAPDAAANPDVATSPDGQSAPDAQSPTDTQADAGPLARGLYVNPAAGLDENTGTMAAPFKTIAKAAMEAKTGETIWLMDGVYDKTTEPRLDGVSAAPCGFAEGISIPAGVHLRAVNPGAAKLQGTASHILCMNGGIVSDIDIHMMQGNRAIEVLSGENTVTGVKVTGPGGCGGSGNEAAIAAFGTAKLTILPGRVADYGDAQICKWAQAWEDAVVTVMGGTFNFSASSQVSGSAIFVARDKGTMRLVNISLTSVTATAVTLGGEGKVLIEGGTFEGNAADPAIRFRAEGANATITGATFRKWSAGVSLDYGYSVDGTVVVKNSQFKENRFGVVTGVDSRSTITLENSVFSQNQSGLGLGGIYTLSMTGGQVTDNTMGSGIHLQGVCTATIRGVTVTGNADNGVHVVCTGASMVDLGTRAMPGGNTFQNNGQPAQFEANLFVQSNAPMIIQAVGNTWAPDTQGSNAQGAYEVTAQGETKLEVTSGSGANYRIVTGTVRLAEK